MEEARSLPSGGVGPGTRLGHPRAASWGWALGLGWVGPSSSWRSMCWDGQGGVVPSVPTEAGQRHLEGLSRGLLTKPPWPSRPPRGLESLARRTCALRGPCSRAWGSAPPPPPAPVVQPGSPPASWTLEPLFLCLSVFKLREACPQLAHSVPTLAAHLPLLCWAGVSS